MNEALAVPDVPLQINHANVEAVRLLAQGRAPEADTLLQGALKNDPNNVFTLNNMGVAKEMEGESQEALQYYDQAADSRSDATAVVTVDRTWRGKPPSEIAAARTPNICETACNLRTLWKPGWQSSTFAASRRSIATIYERADEDFRKAFALDPNNRFRSEQHWLRLLKSRATARRRNSSTRVREKPMAQTRRSPWLPAAPRKV